MTLSHDNAPQDNEVGIAQLAEHLTEKPGTILTQLRVSGAARNFFSQHQLPVQTLLQCPYSPHVQSHASTSVSTLKIPNTGSRTIVWTQYCTHIDRNVLVAAVLYPGMVTRIPTRASEALPKINFHYKRLSGSEDPDKTLKHGQTDTVTRTTTTRNYIGTRAAKTGT